jgi:hypothetical protein
MALSQSCYSVQSFLLQCSAILEGSVITRCYYAQSFLLQCSIIFHWVTVLNHFHYSAQSFFLQCSTVLANSVILHAIVLNHFFSELQCPAIFHYCITRASSLLQCLIIFHCYNARPFLICYSAQSFLISTACATTQSFCKMTEHGARKALSHFVEWPTWARGADGGSWLERVGVHRREVSHSSGKRGARGGAQAGLVGSVGWLDR